MTSACFCTRRRFKDLSLLSFRRILTLILISLGLALRRKSNVSISPIGFPWTFRYHRSNRELQKSTTNRESLSDALDRDNLIRSYRSSSKMIHTVRKKKLMSWRARDTNMFSRAMHEGLKGKREEGKGRKGKNRKGKKGWRRSERERKREVERRGRGAEGSGGERTDGKGKRGREDREGEGREGKGREGNGRKGKNIAPVFHDCILDPLLRLFTRRVMESSWNVRDIVRESLWLYFFSHLLW